MDVVASDRVIKPSPPRRSARGDKAIYTVLESINGSSASQKRSGITSIAEILKQRKLPDSVLPSVIDTLQACVNGNNHKISLQALRCLKQLISRTFGHAAIKGFLPSIAETVGERWGDMKDEVRMTALDTSLDIARLWVFAERYKDVAARLMKAAGEQEKEDVRRAQGCQDEQDQETTYNTQDGSSVTRPPQQA